MKGDRSWATLSSVAEVFADGDWIETKDQSDAGIRLIQTGNVGLGQFKDRADKARYIDETTFDRLRCTEVVPGDCLISRLPDPVGRACIVPETGEKMITAVDCTIVRFAERQMVPEFFVYYTQTREYVDAVAARCTGTTRNRISRANLGGIAVPVPPLGEQKRIVEVLGKALEGLTQMAENAERNLDRARILYRSGLARLTGASSDVFPQHELQALVVEGAPITYGVVKPGEHGEVPFVRGGDLRDGKIDIVALRTITGTVSAQYRRTVLEGGELLVCLVGQPGQTGIVPPELRGANIARQTALVRLGNLANAEFVSFFLLSDEGQRRLGAFTQGSVQQVINLEDLRKVRVPVPPRDVQDLIATRCRDLRIEVERLEELYRSKRAAVDDLRQSLLQKAFAGELT